MSRHLAKNNQETSSVYISPIKKKMQISLNIHYKAQIQVTTKLTMEA